MGEGEERKERKEKEKVTCLLFPLRVISVLLQQQQHCTYTKVCLQLDVCWLILHN